MGAHYHHTTPEMATRVVTAIQARPTVVVRTAEETSEALSNRLAPHMLYKGTEASCSVWHGHGTAGEEDYGSGLLATVPAWAMGEARPG